MIIIVNFGSQFSHLIARRIRELEVEAILVPHNISAQEIKKLNPKGIILSGGPSSVYERGAPNIDTKIFDLDIPILGICYGLQLIGKKFGEVKKHSKKEFGKANLKVSKKSLLLRKIPQNSVVWMSHGDQVQKLKRTFTTIASTNTCSHAAIEDKKNNIYGIQFHPEVVHTEYGREILSNFIFKVCSEERNFKIKKVEKQIVSKIKEKVADKEVLMAVSGGVDSTVAATLIQKAIGNRLHCVFVDNGLLRKDEAKKVRQVYEKLFSNFYFINSSSLFLGKLKGVTNPEKKRKIVGHTFIEVFEDKAKKLKRKHSKIVFLGQGTIYPDRIESAQPSKKASKIKSHHNLSLPKKMGLKVLEPLEDLYKDEVRTLGLSLGIQKPLLLRHPFPGPGLSIRIPGEVTPQKVKILQEVDDILIKELVINKQYNKIWQAFAALLPVKSVGVMGDKRTYDYIVSIRLVNSVDGMTADWVKIPYPILEKISSRIVNEVKGVNRVLYDITQKPPGTIEYE